MKKELLIIASAIALAGCGQQAGKSNQTADSAKVEATDSTAAAAADPATQLKAIYADVFGWYTKAENDISLLDKMPDFEAKYMSTDYNNLLAQVKEADKPLEAKGEIGYFDHDPWVCGQDFQGLAFDVVSTSQTDDSHCTVTADVTNCGTKTRLDIVLVKEGNDWKIDDFVNDKQSEKAQMKQYLESAKK